MDRPGLQSINELAILRAKLESIETDISQIKTEWDFDKQFPFRFPHYALRDLTVLACAQCDCLKALASLTLASKKGPYATQPI